MFTCPKCGKELDDRFTFCPFCGETIKQAGDVTGTASTSSFTQPDGITDNLVQTGKKKKTVALFIAIAIAVIGIVTAVILVFGQKCEHEYVAAITKEPSCNIKGVKTFTCSKCGDSYDEEIPLIEHKYVGEQTTAPTCEKEGTTTFTCSVCGDAYTEPIEKLPHSFGDVVIVREATCSEEGEMAANCIVCGETGITEKIPMIPHTYSSEVTKDSTCTSTGIRAFTCDVCGDSYTEDIDKIAHSYKSSITKDPTCISTGIRTFTCDVCGDKYTEDVDIIAHNYNSIITTAASCTTAGIVTYTCQYCGASYNETVASLGHDYKESLDKNVTCTENGILKYTCSRCGDNYTEEITAYGHDFVAADCWSPMTCTRCGHTEGEALGHTVKAGRCTRCGGVILPVVNLPSCPITVLSKAGSEIRIDSISHDFTLYTSQWGLKLEISGECISKVGGSIQIDVIVTDKEGYTYRKYFYLSGVEAGDKFRNEDLLTPIWIPVANLSEEYTVVFEIVK